MKADISAKGVLSVIPESSLESFALHQWWKDYREQEIETLKGIPYAGNRFTALEICVFENTDTSE